MKKNIHPTYGPVTFQDQATGNSFTTQSTLGDSDSGETPVITVDVTSESHPFWTGKKSNRDAEGRVAAFNRRYGH